MRSSYFICASALFLCLLAGNSHLWGQLTLSPFSRFGVGDLLPQQEVGSLSMGGLTTVLDYPTEVNSSNPASYASLTQPSLQMSLRVNLLQLENATQTQRLNGTAINSLQLGVPFGKRWGLAFGITPYSAAGYSITSESDLGDTGVRETYDGSGGINKTFAGLSKKLRFAKAAKYFRNSKGQSDSLVYYLNTLAVGANVDVLFGTIDKTRRLAFDNSSYLNTRTIESNRYRGIGSTVGLMYRRNLHLDVDRDRQITRKDDIVVGATWNTDYNVKNVGSESVESTYSFFATEIDQDSVSFTSSNTITTLPSKLSVGVGFDRTRNYNNWFVGAQFTQQDWSQFKSREGQTFSEFTALTEIGVGVQWTPHVVIETDRSVWQLTTYRLGAKQTTTNLTINGAALERSAITLGFAMPLLASGSNSRFNFGMELGTRGDVEQNLVKENYVNFNFGFTLTPNKNSRWFVQRKYN